jgi:DNA-binding transcriptional LysR family regulator
MSRAMMTRLRLRHFTLLRALDQQRNMHRAAGVLNMTQSTASKLLKDVEDIMGTELFHRETRGMSPTDIGYEVLRFAEEMLTRTERFSAELQSMLAGGHGMLVIGAIMGAAPDLVAHVVAEMKAERPLLTIRMLGETSDNILEMFEAGEIDIAVGRFSASRHHALFDFEHLSEEPLAFVVRRDHPLAGKDQQVPLEDLHALPWILQPVTTPTRQILDRAFAELTLGTPRNHVESVSLFAILHLIQTSDAITLLPVSVVRDHLTAGLVARLRSTVEATVPGFGILTRRDTMLSKFAQDFAEKLRAAASRTSVQMTDRDH